MIPAQRVVLSLALLGSSLAANIQVPNIILPSSASQQRAAVQDIFSESYAAYTKYAFGHDNLDPLSQSYVDDRNGWGATIVDAMDTMYIMGLNDLFLQAVNFSSQINFSKSQTTDNVSVFETTIRYLGGILSAYEQSNKQYPVLLQRAIELGDKLAFAWVGDNDIPYGHLDFASNTPQMSTSNIAEAGSLTLEFLTLSKYKFLTLSKYSGNTTYANLALRSVKHIAKLPSPLPGLAAQGINPSTGGSIGGYVSWGGGSDSYFEYLIKYARLSNTDDNVFADTWNIAVNSSIHTLMKVSTVGNHVYLADYDNSRMIRHVGSHLACFHGGNWLMGGRLLNNQTIVDIGLELVDACWNTYAGDVTGIGPEEFAYISPDGNYTAGYPITSQQLDFYNKHGYYITTPYYIQRPEVLESNFYAFRVTGDEKYLERAASAIDSFNKYLKTPNGFACLKDVNADNAPLLDAGESFWYAEVLKYLYLTFDDPNHISLDNYVFNTEAHPFIAPPSKPVYGSMGSTGSSGPTTAHNDPSRAPKIVPHYKSVQG